jgi:hypothetical protein
VKLDVSWMPHAPAGAKKIMVLQFIMGIIIYKGKGKVNISLLQAMEAHRVARG